MIGITTKLAQNAKKAKPFILKKYYSRLAYSLAAANYGLSLGE